MNDNPQIQQLSQSSSQQQHSQLQSHKSDKSDELFDSEEHRPYVFTTSQYAHFAVMNRVNYPYSRAHNYFFDLSKFPRASVHLNYNKQDEAQGSSSYAIDETNKFGFTFSQQDKKIGNITVGELLNRKLFGCPLNDGVRVNTKDKNICHSYLFSSQDAKYEVERMLYQLRCVRKRLQTLTKEQKLQTFECIIKDPNMWEIFDKNKSMEEKQEMIDKKIKVLEEKRLSVMQIVSKDDSAFYYGSLNQSLYNKIQQKLEQRSIVNILSAIIHRQNVRLRMTKSDKEMFDCQINTLFRYQNSDKLCVSQKFVKQFSEQFTDDFTVKSSDGFFKIEFPFVFLSFANAQLFAFVEQLIGCAIFNLNQGSFYILRKLWRKVFDRQLPEVRLKQFDSRNSYIGQLSDLCQKIQKQLQQKKGKQSLVFPELDDAINLVHLSDKSNNIFARNDEADLTSKEYIMVLYIHQIYLGLSKVCPFVEQSELLMHFMTHQYYNKYQHMLLTIVNNQNFGVVEDVLMRLIDFVLKPELEFEMFFKIKYDSKKKVAYIYRVSGESEWESEEQDVEDENENNFKVVQNNKQNQEQNNKVKTSQKMQKQKQEQDQQIEDKLQKKRKLE